jgi:hypothetical protein
VSVRSLGLLAYEYGEIYIDYSCMALKSQRRSSTESDARFGTVQVNYSSDDLRLVVVDKGSVKQVSM